MTPISKTLKNVANFVKPACTWPKMCYISLINIHSFVLQTKHFHWSSRYSCVGNCLIWKVNLREKTLTLHGWTQMVVTVVAPSDKFNSWQIGTGKSITTFLDSDLWIPNSMNVKRLRYCVGWRLKTETKICFYHRTSLKRLHYHRERFRKLTFRAVACRTNCE